jgi:hypothetical protein
VRALDRLTKPRIVDDKTVKGINFFDPTDKRPSARPAKPAHQYRRHSTRRSPLAPRPLVPAQISRQLRRLRDIGVIKRVTEPIATTSLAPEGRCRSPLSHHSKHHHPRSRMTPIHAKIDKSQVIRD